MSSSNFQHGFRRLVAEERSLPPDHYAPFVVQPFLQTYTFSPLDRFVTNLTREQGAWRNVLSREQTAYALAQVSAGNVLPSLVNLNSGYALLEYAAHLPDHMDRLLLTEFVHVLQSDGQDLHWGKVDSAIFAAVIGAGVAACIDITPNHETLYLRYANALEMEFSTMRRAAELSRSALFLQSALHERFDAILERVRERVWLWLMD